jgi:ankyrin repeat protein
VLQRCGWALVLGLLLSLSAFPARALTGPEALRVAESGTVEEFAQVFAAHTVDELFRVRREGRGLLHLAVVRGEPFWRLALSAGWPVADESGWTPQHEAALAGQDKAMEALIRAGAPVDVREPANGGTPLHVAAFNGRLAVVKVLVAAGANVNARDNDGWTPLSQARDQGYPDIVDWLRSHGASR